MTGDTYKVKQLQQMRAHEVSATEEHYGARLNHWYGDTKTLTIDAGGLKALIAYYSEHETDLDAPGEEPKSTNGRFHLLAVCPVCRKTEWAGEQDGCFICANCGARAEAAAMDLVSNKPAENEDKDVVEAAFFSVWDCGDICVETSCKVNLKTREVFDIEESEEWSDAVDSLDEQYIILPDGARAEVIRESELEEDDEESFWYEG